MKQALNPVVAVVIIIVAIVGVVIYVVRGSSGGGGIPAGGVGHRSPFAPGGAAVGQPGSGLPDQAKSRSGPGGPPGMGGTTPGGQPGGAPAAGGQ